MRHRRLKPETIARGSLRTPLLVAAALVALVKSIEFAVDSQAIFFVDSGAYMLNALRLAFVPFRSYVYGDLIRVFALPFHSLSAIVAMQITMGGLTAWILAFALLRFFGVRAAIAIAAAIVFAVDPVQIVHEHLVLSETAAMLATAVFLVAALKYLSAPAPWWLVVLSFAGMCLVSLRMVYLPVILTAAVLLPPAAYFPESAPGVSRGKRLRLLALALMVSCGSTFVFQSGYRHWTGRLAGREPAWHYSTGYFLLAAVSPIVESRDTADRRVADAITAQNENGLPLITALRNAQLWEDAGLIARLRQVLGGDKAADEAAQQVARAAIRRNPLGFLRLGLVNYVNFWLQIPKVRRMLEEENGMRAPPSMSPREGFAISSAFGEDVSHQDTRRTPSRRYHIAAGYWYVFLLVSPFLAALAFWLGRANPKANPKGLALLLVWSCLLLTATCLGGVESAYRFLHPFSFTGIAVTAMLAEITAGRERGSGHAL